MVKFQFFLAIIGFFLLGFCISQAMGDVGLDISLKEKNISASEMEIIEKCQNKSLEDGVYCLRDEIEPFYKYKITDDSEELTFEELKKKGGDCRDYALLYERLGTGIGFNATTRRFAGIDGVMPPHRFAVIWDNEKFCYLDLLKVNCMEIEK